MKQRRDALQCVSTDQSQFNKSLMEKYQGKYRISSNRYQDYDYSASGAYFVTICTKNKEFYFGKIVSGIMELSGIGEVARDEWLKTPSIRPDMNIVLDEFCIMPNHTHGIIIFYHETPRRDAMHCVSTHIFQNQFGPQSKNLASVIRGFKAAVKSYATMNNIEFSWQSRYYDHIIRDENDFNRIKMYIKENPVNWEKDEYW